MNVNILNIIKGTIYGIFSVIPGLSGGIIANYFGDYTKCLEIIIGDRPLTDNLIYLLSISFGFVLGVIISSNVIIFLYNRYTLFFISFVIFCNIYILYKMLVKTTLKISTFCIIISMCIIGIYCLNNTNLSLNESNIFSGCIIPSILYSLSKVIPGISSTSILINIGFYKELMNFFINPISSFVGRLYFWIIFWVIFIIFSFFLLKLVNRLIKSRYFDYLIIIIVTVNLLILLLKCCI